MNHNAIGAREAGLFAVWASLFVAMEACEPPSQAREGSGTYFTLGTSAYQIGPATAWLPGEDESASFGSVIAILGTDSGYVVADGWNQELAFLDPTLRPLRKVGRRGEGPGEYQFPRRLVRQGETVAVLDEGLVRVSELTSTGDFVRSHQASGLVHDLAMHPDLGVLVTGNAFPDHYLVRVTDGALSGFALVPEAFQPDGATSLQLPSNLVTVTPDGLVHVLDGRQLALVSYDQTGEQTGLVLLPREVRTRQLDEAARITEAFGGPQTVLAVQSVTELRTLADGRLFVRVTDEANLGFVLDLHTFEATPVAMPSGEEEWMRSATTFFDGSLLVAGTADRGLTIAEARLVR